MLIELIINKKGMFVFLKCLRFLKKSVLKHFDRTVYAQVVQGQAEIPQTNVTQLNPPNMTKPVNDLAELKQIMKK